MFTIRSGTRLGHYEVIAPLGSGGMGEVYRARDTRLDRFVAIKVLPKHLQTDEDALQRFEREAKIISGLNHPHILTIHGIGKNRLPGDARASHYIVTELIDGTTLREVMANERNARILVEYMAQVADALQKAHTAGVIHRDLKPENIMVSSDGYAKVLDFGLAKVLGTWFGTLDDDQSKTDRWQTQRGVVIGTAGYMSPEQIQGRPLDPRSDIFSFGCILYEVLAGRTAFDAETLFDVLHQIVHAPPAALPAQVNTALRVIVVKCLEKKPESRFDSMKTLAAALRDALRDSNHSIRAPTRKSRVLKTPLSSRIKTIAVMPFANTSDDPDMEYLSDGVTESIIHSLSRVGKRLRVTARSTVFTYKNKPYTPQQLAAELGVAVVVDGRVQRVRGEVVITIELIDTRNGSQIWGDRFRKPFSDIFIVQDEISAQISDQLKLQLSPSEKKRLVVAGTQKSEAYELYLKGCFYVNKRTIEGVERAIQNFEKAIEIDPSYALAHAGLADCNVILGARFLAPPDEGYKRAAGEARRAAELDPTLAEPHATIGHVSFLYDWDWEAADRAFRHAIMLNPRYATAHHWYSIFLCWMGRMEESLREARMAIEIEPLSTIMNLNYADLLYFAGRNEEALSHVSNNTVDFESHFLAHLLIGRIYASQGHYEEALTEVGAAIMLEGRYPELLATLGSIYGEMGDTERARKVLRDLEEIAAEKFVAPIFFAEVYAAIGEVETALKHAEAFLAMRGDIGELVAGPRFARLRSDPRYDEMLARLNFPAPLPPEPGVHTTAKL